MTGFFNKIRKALFLTLIIIILLPSAADAAYLNVTFLDAGEGESILLEMPTGENILIDAGNPITGHRVKEVLKDKGIKLLDAVFITHPHLDHMGGIFHIFPNFDIKAIYGNGQHIPDNPECDIYRWYKESVMRQNYKIVKSGDVFKYGNVNISVLWTGSNPSQDWNSNSLVLKASYGNVEFLFMGDANKAAEDALLKGSIDLKADVLKVGHHGADDATGNEFIKNVLPQYAVISINKDNVRNYPSAKTLKRLKENNAEILTTYDHGSIRFRTDGISISYTSSKVNN